MVIKCNKYNGRSLEDTAQFRRGTLHNDPFPTVGRYGFAASALLRTITMTPENRIMWVILDSGASSHFLLSEAPVHDKEIATNPLSIKLPDGKSIKSRKTANIALPHLPPRARLAHIVHGLTSNLLISVVKLYNAGCKVKMKDI